MADTTALSTARAQLMKTQAERAADREEFLKRDRARKEEMKQALEVAKREKAELRKELKGPNLTEVGADLVGLVVGEASYRAIGFALAKLGAKHWLWYTLPGTVGGTALYVLAYPRREEGIIRASLRSLGLTWQIIGVHDSISFMMESGSQNKAAVARAVAENEQLRQQLAQVQQRQAPPQQQR